MGRRCAAKAGSALPVAEASASMSERSMSCPAVPEAGAVQAATAEPLKEVTAPEPIAKPADQAAEKPAEQLHHQHQQLFQSISRDMLGPSLINHLPPLPHET